MFHKINEIVKTPFFQSFVTLVTGVGIPLLIWVSQDNRKSLSFEYTSPTPILSVNQDNTIQKELQISYKGKPVNQMHYIILTIKNNGKSAIEPDDFASPITIQFNNAQIFMTTIIEANPNSLKSQLKIKQQNNKILIDKTLLNKGDIFKVQILLTNNKFSTNEPKILPEPQARIKGISKFENENDDFMKKLKPIIFIILFPIPTCIILLISRTLYKKFYMNSTQRDQIILKLYTQSSIIHLYFVIFIILLAIVGVFSLLKDITNNQNDIKIQTTTLRRMNA